MAAETVLGVREHLSVTDYWRHRGTKSPTVLASKLCCVLPRIDFCADNQRAVLSARAVECCLKSLGAVDVNPIAAHRARQHAYIGRFNQGSPPGVFASRLFQLDPVQTVVTENHDDRVDFEAGSNAKFALHHRKAAVTDKANDLLVRAQELCGDSSRQ
jgi:hypothetical protein